MLYESPRRKPWLTVYRRRLVSELDVTFLKFFGSCWKPVNLFCPTIFFHDKSCCSAFDASSFIEFCWLDVENELDIALAMVNNFWCNDGIFDVWSSGALDTLTRKALLYLVQSL